jgi:hypothetical protein
MPGVVLLELLHPMNAVATRSELAIANTTEILENGKHLRLKGGPREESQIKDEITCNDSDSTIARSTERNQFGLSGNFQL